MKQIIDGKMYNTDTATKIADLPCHFYPRDFGWHSTSIYVTPKGRLFVAGRGNALSRWAVPVGNNGHGSGSGIEPLTKAQAADLLETCNADADAYHAAGIEIEEA